MKHVFTWHDLLSEEKKKHYFLNILNTIAKERQAGVIIYPQNKDIFNVFRFTEFSDIKVVIIGQDPYNKPNLAHGLAFSVRPNIALPSSLVNIYKELECSMQKFIRPTHGCLESWAHQGVMLLNSILTVRNGQSSSHANLGWEIFTNKVISLINHYLEKIVFLLWGLHAHKKEIMIDKRRHFILKAAHPSPLSAHRGFFGCNHFVLTNQYLQKHGKKPIDWTPMLKH